MHISNLIKLFLIQLLLYIVREDNDWHQETRRDSSVPSRREYRAGDRADLWRITLNIAEFSRVSPRGIYIYHLMQIIIIVIILREFLSVCVSPRIYRVILKYVRLYTID